MIADMMDDYETIGIDCVAMNVNDLICVGAKPVSMLDYIGVEYANAFWDEVLQVRQILILSPLIFVYYSMNLGICQELFN